LPAKVQVSQVVGVDASHIARLLDLLSCKGLERLTQALYQRYQRPLA